MRLSLHRVGTVLIAGALAVSAAVASGSPAAALAGPQGGGHRDDGGRYLALGDSVPFGFSPLVAIPSDPKLYVGYPEIAGRRLDLDVTNLSCPGQTSAGFLALTGADNGCFKFRSVARLHSSYSGSQLQAALGFLSSHRRTKLVTIMLGANDLFLCVRTTADGCTNPQEVRAALATYASNLTTALTAIRGVYQGRLEVVTYYTTDFSNPATVRPIQALNAVTSAVAAQLGVTVADGYTPFANRAAGFGGSSCAAGLLIELPNGTCNIHPSPEGARLLARAVARAAH